ncbi:TauD/TfdA family dioxygenase [Streptomyces sp. NPDC052052]|uniref:TauD/TfdA family dioxygenase n=1 Tax=Streptomyces sp. NPDC052052 TaxID=3154756 RepID=UPI003429D05A
MKDLKTYTLDEAEILELRDAVAELGSAGASPVEPEFYDKFPDCDDLLPAGLRTFLTDYRDDPGSTVCQIHGFPVDEATVGPTPDHWERPDGYDSTVENDIFHAMCATALGEPFAWATLQYGRMVQDIFPIRGDEHRESGHGSDAFLQFHTDDAFRPDAPDYLMLFGVRNPDVVPTYVAAVRDIRLSEQDRRLLSEKRFHILPDDEHIRQLELRAPDEPMLRRAIEMRDRPEPVPVLFGDERNPRIRIDIPFMRCVGEDPESARALTTLHTELERVQRPLIAAQGTLLILDNRSVVHARGSFSARYDGTDRWLRKIVVGEGLAADGFKPLSRVLF